MMVPPPAWFAGAKRLSPEGRSLPPEPGCRLWAAAFTSLVAPACSLLSSFPLGAPTPGSLPSCRGSVKTRRGPPAQSPAAATHTGQPPGASPAAANPAFCPSAPASCCWPRRLGALPTRRRGRTPAAAFGSLLAVISAASPLLTPPGLRAPTSGPLLPAAVSSLRHLSSNYLFTCRFVQSASSIQVPAPRTVPGTRQAFNRDL